MPKPHFVFTQRKNSFSVHIPNLEALDVATIQAIEDFVAKRKGIFDFNSYIFSIPKRIEFHEFVSLLKHLGIEAECIQKELSAEPQSNTVSFGQYKGMAYSELPDAYLVWLKNNYRGKELKYIQQELQSRNL
ncbi:MAG: DUF3820 family protein [Epsilonproteobacteria bacterium]|nr:DUF3820 family protein [Campylobacterota bacterium]